MRVSTLASTGATSSAVSPFPSVAPVFFTRKEVSRISTLTIGQIHHLESRGIQFPFARIAHNRCYSPEHVFRFLLIRELQVREFTVDSIKRILGEVANTLRFGLPWERGLRWLLTDGATVHFIKDPDVVLAFLEQRRSPAFVTLSLAYIEERMKLARPAQVKLTPPVVKIEAKPERKSLEQWSLERRA